MVSRQGLYSADGSLRVRLSAGGSTSGLYGPDGALNITIVNDYPEPEPPSVVLWTPLDLGAELLAWWNADDPAVGAVTTWTDRIQALAPTNGTAGFKPIKSATSFNSAYAGVTFDGTDDRLRVSSVGTLPISTNSSSIYALVSQATGGVVAGGMSAFSYGGGGAHEGRNLQRGSSSSINRIRSFDATTAITDTSFDFSGPHIVSVRFASAVATLFFDGKATTPASGATAFTTVGTITSLGCSTAGVASAFWNGVIRHVFVTAVLSDANRQKLEGWMAWDTALTGNLDVSHPYKLAAPTV